MNKSSIIDPVLMKFSLGHMFGLAGIVLTCTFLILGQFFPDLFWGTHYFNYLDGYQKITFGLIALAALFLPIKVISELNFAEPSSLKATLLIPLVCAVVYGLLIHLFPMVYDPYGDAVYLEETGNTVWSDFEISVTDFFTFENGAWSGRKNVMLIAQFFSSLKDITQLASFRLIGIITGSFFAFVLIKFCLVQFQNSILGLLFGLGVLFSPFALNFFGHSESYPPSLLTLLVWSVCLLQYWQKPSFDKLIMLFALNGLCFLFHPMAVLLIPSTMISVFHQFKVIKAEPSWSIISLWVLLPVFLLGIYAYFFVFGDHVDDRDMQDYVFQYDHLFLPLISPDPPLDNYNLLGWNHLFDFANLLVLWSPGLLLLFATAIWAKTKRLAFSGDRVLALAVILYMSLVFVINPLLSMPMDWDLYCLPLPMLIVYVLAYTSREIELIPRRMISLTLAVFVLSTSFIFMHRVPDAISNRLQSIAIHVYNTYYSWGSIILERSFVPNNCSERERILQRSLVIEKLRPNAQSGVDYIFAHILTHQGRSYCNQEEYDSGINLFNEALYYHPENVAATDGLMTAYFAAKDFKEAFKFSEKLVNASFPSKEKALRKTIHCAVEAGLYQEAHDYAATYLALYSSPVIQEIFRRTELSEDLITLKILFQSTQN